MREQKQRNKLSIRNLLPLVINNLDFKTETNSPANE